MSTTRDGLLAAAATAFERHGYARATIEDVCDLAGVTKGALYGHFGSKKELAIAVLERQATVWAKQVAQVKGSPLQALVDLGYAVHRDRARLLFQAPICEDVAERQVSLWRWMVRDLLHAAAAHGELRDEVVVDSCVEGILAGLVGVHLLSMSTDGSRGVFGTWRSWLPGIAQPTACANLRWVAP
ncbi:ScbR family autoregulator-binding transcription factor [Saccharothrix violaceirubra]|uniref:AcrR family transcriptional regulator n=1 Tax=Saccharothrix violaceirubra TaxID=413306 RepID=A0A7W7WXG0_9PSEU|nr:TetR/AcrR family transcriptional regulator [Saccharothrix violaceirubra]MBB4967067.1 AcrR family transcriptional regulator [Saccharothrix violaceirubra]